MNVQKISVSIPSEMLSLMNEAVAKGDYATTSEVVREALQDWQQKRFAQIKNSDEIQKLWQEGIESGEGNFENIEQLKQEARNRIPKN